MSFATLEQMVVASAEGVRPPERMTVDEAAARYRHLNNPGSYVGPWLNEKTPYLIEPMRELTSLDYTGMVFVGPAQTGKTDVALNWITYTAMCDPADMMIIQTAMATSRDFSKSKVEKLFRYSKVVGNKRTPGRQNRNTFDTSFTSGWRLTMSWPSINELSGKSIPRLWLTDYDRMPEDVDHEGAPFDLARKRATSFRRFGMCVAESTPGFEVENPKWIATSPHQAPPTKGILALYNRGDRRRWQWQCPQCHGTFEPDFKHLVWPDTADMMEAAEQAVLGCPYDGFPITADMKPEIQQGGRWIKDGQIWMPDGQIVGTPTRSDIASFWLKGVAAAFAPWPTLVMNYLKAEQEFEQTGSEEALKTTVNVDQGHPYTPKAALSERLPEELKARARDNGSTREEPLVPAGARFLIATIDVQKNRFVVQVMSFGPEGEMNIVDRFEIRKSERRDEDGERLWVKPDTHPEDWRLIVDQVIERTYPLADGSGRRMAIKATGCDSGGREGVTTNAYNFWRWLRDEHPAGHNRRFILLKGASSPNAPRVAISYPDSERKDRKAGARGEVPILLINPNTLKDQASLALDRKDPGGARLNFPDWLDDRFYTELTAENRTSKGWVKMAGRSNEAWDLFVYGIAVSISRYVGIEHIDWLDPPGWAGEWDVNDLVSASGANQRFEIHPKVDYDLTKLAESLG